jgi:hypothetical protein
MIGDALKKQYGKPLINGLISEYRPRTGSVAILTATFLQQVHSGMRSKLHVAWNPRRIRVYRELRNQGW